MQLKFNRQKSLRESILHKLLKLIVLVGIFVVVVFFIEKINFSQPIKYLTLILQMKLSDLNKILILIFIFNFLNFNLHGEEEVDIWKNNSSNQEKKKKPNNIEDKFKAL